ncbi:MAG: hypothetical protein HFJ55_04000 [Clostridia bacterium]|jgi:hypothetical protein|nr:hypothetical protein [Clostridia bacterium]
MKKMIIFLILVIAIICFIGFKYYSYQIDYTTILAENEEYEKYKEKEVYGLDLTTLINRAIDANIKNKVEKDGQGFYINNNKDSIEIEIYMKDNETTYKIETFYNSIEGFIENYKDIKFKCTKIEYHKDTNKIKYMLFEQL